MVYWELFQATIQERERELDRVRKERGLARRAGSNARSAAAPNARPAHWFSCLRFLHRRPQPASAR